MIIKSSRNNNKLSVKSTEFIADKKENNLESIKSSQKKNVLKENKNDSNKKRSLLEEVLEEQTVFED